MIVFRPALAIDDGRNPSLHRADQGLYDALETLNAETRPESDYGGHRDKAIDLIRQARTELEQAAASADSLQPPAADTAAADATYTEEPKYDAPPKDYAPPPEPAVYAAPPPPSSPVGFWGTHPIPGGGWCVAIGPHVHQYEPEFYDQFHLVNGYFKFGEGFHEWAYAGIHPVIGGGWCPISVPHRHPYMPTVGFIYDPLRHGYYYDRQRAVVIRTEIVRAPRNYRPPSEVVVRYRNPPALRRMPPGTVRPQPWAHERVVVERRSVGAHPAVYHQERPHPGAPMHAGPERAAQPHGAAAARPTPVAAKPASATKPARAAKSVPAEKKNKK